VDGTTRPICEDARGQYGLDDDRQRVYLMLMIPPRLRSLGLHPLRGRAAQIAASLWKSTRAVGMSLGDRACLALALQSGLPALTTEEEWLKCDLGVRVVKIR
jgi:hypothetical protein